MEYEKLKNYIKIKKMSETVKNIYLTDAQRLLIQNLLMEISVADAHLNNLVEIDKRVFLMPLLLLEGESTSLIEGTRSMFEDFAFDVEEMNNIPQWETRNLINIYEKYIIDDYYANSFIFSTDSIRNMHIDFFANNQKSKFKMIYDTSKRVEQVSPGKIMSDDDKPNWIGNNNNIEQSSLVMLKPSRKKEFLDDLTKFIEDKINKEELLIDHIILSHPIFEAIHPFRDGNGRIGRLLISLLFKKTYPNIKLPLYISEAFKEKEEEYKIKLRDVQLTNDYQSWNTWISFFISALIRTKRLTTKRIDALIKLWNQFEGTKALSTKIRKKITEAFFKYYKINKNITIKKLQLDFPNVSVQTIYKDFDIVSRTLGVVESNGYYSYENIKEIIRYK